MFRKLNELKHWIRYRTTSRYHKVDTGLDPGYHDIDERMLHANFNLLKEYVELECAWMEVVFDDKAKKKYASTGRGWRSREAGLAHLQWKIDAPNNEEEKKASHDWESMKSVYQREADFASEAKALYLWWVDTRPKRIDPWSAPLVGGLNALEIEEGYDTEDEEHLIRLMKIRRGLWT